MTLVQFWTKFRLEPPGSDSDGGEDLIYALRKEEFEVTPEEEAFCKSITASLVNLHLNFPEIEWIRKKNASCRSRRTKFVCHVQTGDYDALGKGKSAKEAIFDGLESLEYFLPSDEENEPCQFPDFGEDDNCKRTSPFHSPIKIVSVPNAKEYSEDINTTFTKEFLENNATFTKEPVCSAAANFFNEFLEQAGDDVVDHGPCESKEKDLDIGSNLGGIAGEGEHGDLVFNPSPDLSSSPIKDYVCMPENDKPSGVVESDEESNVSGPTSSVEFEFEPELDRIHGFDSQCAEGKEFKAPKVQQEDIFNYDKEVATTFTVLPPECLSKSKIIYGVPELLTLDPINLRFGGLSPILEEDSQLVPGHQLTVLTEVANVACGTFIIGNEHGDDEESPALDLNDFNSKDAECETFVQKIGEDSQLVPPLSHDEVLEVDLVDTSTINLDNKDAECGTYVVEVENEPRDMEGSEPPTEHVEVEVQDSLPRPVIPEVADGGNVACGTFIIGNEHGDEESPVLDLNDFNSKDAECETFVQKIGMLREDFQLVPPLSHIEVLEVGTSTTNLDNEDAECGTYVVENEPRDMEGSEPPTELVEMQGCLPPPAIPEVDADDTSTPLATNAILEIDPVSTSPTPAKPEFEAEDSTSPAAIPNLDAADTPLTPAIPGFEVEYSTSPTISEAVNTEDSLEEGELPVTPLRSEDPSSIQGHGKVMEGELSGAPPVKDLETEPSLIPQIDPGNSLPPLEISELDSKDSSPIPEIKVDAANSSSTPAISEADQVVNADTSLEEGDLPVTPLRSEDPSSIQGHGKVMEGELSGAPPVKDLETEPALIPKIDPENSSPPLEYEIFDSKDSSPVPEIKVDAANSSLTPAISEADQIVNPDRPLEEGELPVTPLRSEDPSSIQGHEKVKEGDLSGALPVKDLETEPSLIPQIDPGNSLPPLEISEFDSKDSSPIPKIKVDAANSSSTPAISEADQVVNADTSLEEGELPVTPLRSEDPSRIQGHGKVMEGELSGAPPVKDLETEPSLIPQIDPGNSLPPLEISELDSKDSSPIPEIKVDAANSSSTPAISEADQVVNADTSLEEGELPVTPLRSEDPSRIQGHGKVMEGELSGAPPVKDLETEPSLIPQIDPGNSLPPLEISELDSKDSSPIPEIKVDAANSSSTPAISEADQIVNPDTSVEEGELPVTPLRSEDSSSSKAQAKALEAEPSVSVPPSTKDLEKEPSGKPSDHEAHTKPERGRRSGSSRGRRGAWRGRPYQYQW